MKRYMNYLKSQKGQGMTEYVVILALVIGLIVAFFPDIQKAIKAKSGEIVGLINNGGKTGG